MKKRIVFIYTQTYLNNEIVDFVEICKFEENIVHL